MNILLPYFPIIFTGGTLPDDYAMVYELYKRALKKHKPENISFVGGSSGGNLAIGLTAYINDMGEGQQYLVSAFRLSNIFCLRLCLDLLLMGLVSLHISVPRKTSVLPKPVHITLLHHLSAHFFLLCFCMKS